MALRRTGTAETSPGASRRTRWAPSDVTGIRSPAAASGRAWIMRHPSWHRTGALPWLALLVLGLQVGAAGEERKVQEGPTAHPEGFPDEALPPGATHRFGSDVFRPRSPTGDLAFSPDGSRLASANINLIHIWDLSTGRPIKKILAPSAFREKRGGWLVERIAWSTDGEWLASRGPGDTVRLWDVATGDEVLDFEGHVHGTGALTFAPRGKILAFASWWDRSVQVWEPVRGRLLWKWRPEASGGKVPWTRAIAFSPDGRIIGAALDDGSAQLWEWASGERVATLAGHEGAATSVGFSGDGKTLVTGGVDKSVRVWDVVTGEETYCLDGHDDEVHGVAVSPDGSRVAARDKGRFVLWNARTGEEIRREVIYAYRHLKSGAAVVFSPDGAIVAVGGQHNILLFNAETGEDFPGRRHTSTVSSIAFSPDGKVLATGSMDRTVRLWDAVTGGALRKIDASPSYVGSVQFSPDGGTLAWWQYREGIFFQDVATGKTTELLDDTQAWAPFAFSPGGRLLATSSEEKAIRVWDLESREMLMEMRGHEAPIISLAFSPDGKAVATAARDYSRKIKEKTIRTWDLTTGKEVLRFEEEGHLGPVAFSPDGRAVAWLSWHGVIRIRDAATGDPLLDITVREEGMRRSSTVRSFAFAPDGRSLASWTVDGRVRLWDLKTGGEIGGFDPQGLTIASIAFSPDGATVATGTNEGVAILWDVASAAPPPGEEQEGPVLGVPEAQGAQREPPVVSEEEVPVRLDAHGQPLPAGAIARIGRSALRHGSAVSAVSFSPDGSTLASGGREGVVVLWDRGTGRELTRFDGHGGGIHGVAFTPDGRTLVSGDPRTIRTWNVETGEQIHRFDSSRGPWLGRFALSPDGRRIGCVGKQATVRLHDISLDKELWRTEGHRPKAISVAFSPDGEVLATGGDYRNKEIHFWNASTGEKVGSIRCKTGTRAMAFTPDGKTLVTGCQSGPILFWNVAGRSQVGSSDASVHGLAGIGVSPDGQIAAAAGRSSVHLFDVATGREMRVIEGRHGYHGSVAFSPDGRTLAWGGGDQTIGLWDVESGKAILAGDGRDRGITHVALSPDGRFLATSHWSGGSVEMIRLWEVASEREIHEVGEIRGTSIQGLAFSPDGGTLAALDRHSTIHLLDGKRGVKVSEIREEGRTEVALFAFTGEGDRIVLGEMREGLRLRDERTGKEVATLRCPAVTVGRMTISADGRILGYARKEEVEVIDLVSREGLHTFPMPGVRVRTLQISPDGSTLVVGGALELGEKGNRLHLFSLQTGTRLPKLTGHTGEVNALAFSPRGRLLASGSDDGTVRLWDLPRGSEAARLRGHKGPVTAVTFSTDGRVLVSGGKDSTALIWDVARAAPATEPGGKTLSDADIDRLWDLLAADLVGVARRAQAELAQGGTTEVAYLEERLAPPVHVSPEMRRLVADLSSPDLRARAWAAESLGGLGVRAEPALLEGLDGGPSSGSRGQILAILRAIPVGPASVRGEDLRWSRALKVLEAIGTEEAMAALGRLALSASSSAQRAEAEAARARLELRGGLDEGTVEASRSGTREPEPSEGGKPAGRRGADADRPSLGRAELGKGPLLPRIVFHESALTFRSGAHSISFSPDGRLLAAGTAHEGVLAWDVDTRREILRLTTDKGVGGLVAFSPGGKTLATVDPGGVHLWSLPGGNLLDEAPDPEQARFMGTRSLGFSPDGRTLATIGASIELWDVETLTRTRAIPTAGSAIAFSPDGRTLGSGNGGVVTLWEASTGKEIFTLTKGNEPDLGHGPGRDAVAFSPDGRMVASGADDGTVRVWEVATGQEVFRLEGHRHFTCAVAFSPGGSILASGGYDRTVRLWDPFTGEALRVIDLGRPGSSDQVTTLAFSPDGRGLAAGGRDRGVSLWEFLPGQLQSHRAPVSAVAVSPDGERIASGSWDREVRIWDATSCTFIRLFAGHEGWILALAFSPDGERLASASADGAVFVRDLETGMRVIDVRHEESGVLALAYSPDGTVLASAGWAGAIRLWNAGDGEEIRTLQGHEGGVICLAFSPTGNRIASGGWDRSVRIRDTVTGEERMHVGPTGAYPLALAFSADGASLTVASSDGQSLVLDATTGVNVLRPDGGGDRVSAAAVTYGGSGVAFGLPGAGVRVRDVQAGSVLARQVAHDGAVTSLAFSQDGRVLVSGSVDATLAVWDLTRPGGSILLGKETVQATDLEAWWADLAKERATHAYAAMRRLSTAGAAALPFLEKKLHSAGVKVQEIESLIGRLDSDDFSIREGAFVALRERGDEVEASLRQVFDSSPSPEVRHRVEQLLEILESPVLGPGPVLQRTRAIQVLERIGSTEAVRALAHLARKSPSPQVRRHAEGALRRLGHADRGRQ